MKVGFPGLEGAGSAGLGCGGSSQPSTPGCRAGAYGIHAPYLIARAGRSGRICGALPLFVVRNFLGGYATTGLFGAYASALADTPETGRALLQCAQGLAEADGLRYLLVKAVGDEPGATGFSRHDTCVVATLPIDAGAEQLWRGFRGSIRQAVRKAQKVGFTVHAGPSELGPFYDVLAENMHHKGTPIYGIQFLRTLLQELGPSGDIVTLRLGGRTVAGAFTIEHRGVVCVPFASSRPEVLAHCPNNLLYWELIQRACGRGLRCLDFGRSPRGAGSLTFKLRWGATVTPAPFFVRTANGKAPALDPLTPGVQFLAHLWQRLPRKLADVWGPSVCGRFLA